MPPSFSVGGIQYHRRLYVRLTVRTYAVRTYVCPSVRLVRNVYSGTTAAILINKFY